MGGPTSGDATQIDIHGLAGLLSGLGYTREAPFFAAVSDGDQRPASWRMRLTVLGLTRGTQLLALASSAARRCLPHSGWCWRKAISCCSTAAGVRGGRLGARLANWSKAA